jgi:membrane protein implicated in regulation of membrane protease activity
MTASIYWLIVGVICLALEGFGISGIGFLFAGFAAFLVGILIETSLISVDAYIAQFAWFFACTALSAALLWKPMKNWRLTKRDASYSNMIGERALVHGAPLVKGKEGSVMWSGTPMIAELIGTSSVENVAMDETVIIKDIKGNKLFVDVQ